jgi:hypothetical protein
MQRTWLLTDIAPNRCPVNHIAVPDDGVDEENQAVQASPSHEQTCSCIPSCDAYFSSQDTPSLSL